MGDTFKTVRTGEPLDIAADWKNLGNEVFRAYQKGKIGGGIPSFDARAPSGVVILLKNKTGANVSRFTPLKIDVPVFTPADSLGQFKETIVHEALTAQAQVPFAVTLEPIGTDKIGRALMSGLIISQVNYADTHLPYADGNGSNQLEGRGDGYARVLWKESGTGVKWSVLQLGAGPQVYFPVDLSKTGGSNGTVTSSASWVYTVTCPGWDGGTAQLGTSVSPARGRPNGTATIGSSGQARYSGSSLILWGTDELYGTGSCP